MNEKMIEHLKHTLKSLAVADAILSPEWEYRYFSYDSKWGQDEEMASMRDGSGGHWFVLFQGNQVGYKFISPDDGLMSDLEDVKKQISEKYKDFLDEPAFYIDQATGIWLLEDGEWLKFGIPRAQHIEDLPLVAEWGHEGYRRWAEDYYEREVDIDALMRVFELEITPAIVSTLNSELEFANMAEDLEQIGIQS